MAKLTPGYWQNTYWPDRYWQTAEQYWPEFGTRKVTNAVATDDTIYEAAVTDDTIYEATATDDTIYKATLSEN